MKSTNSFENHLFWPTPITTQQKVCREKLPLAISSKVYMKYLEDKENAEKKEEGEKSKRKANTAEKKKNATKRINTMETENDRKNKYEMFKIKCSECDGELISYVENDKFKNIGCNKCTRSYYLMWSI